MVDFSSGECNQLYHVIPTIHYGEMALNFPMKLVSCLPRNIGARHGSLVELVAESRLAIHLWLPMTCPSRRLECWCHWRWSSRLQEIWCEICEPLKWRIIFWLQTGIWAGDYIGDHKWWIMVVLSNCPKIARFRSWKALESSWICGVHMAMDTWVTTNISYCQLLSIVFRLQRYSGAKSGGISDRVDPQRIESLRQSRPNWRRGNRSYALMAPDSTEGSWGHPL